MGGWGGAGTQQVHDAGRWSRIQRDPGQNTQINKKKKSQTKGSGRRVNTRTNSPMTLEHGRTHIHLYFQPHTHTARFFSDKDVTFL